MQWLPVNQNSSTQMYIAIVKLSCLANGSHEQWDLI